MNFFDSAGISQLLPIIIFIVIIYTISKAAKNTEQNKKNEQRKNTTTFTSRSEQNSRNMNSFGYDKESFTYNSSDYKVNNTGKSLTDMANITEDYDTIDTGSKYDTESLKAIETYNKTTVDDAGNHISKSEIIKAIKNRKKLSIPSDYKKITSRIDISHSSFNRSLKSLYFSDNSKKYDAFKTSDIYLKIYKTPEYQLNFRISKDYKLLELKLKILKPTSSQFERLYLEANDYLQVDLIIDLDLMLVDSFVRSTSGQFEVGNYLFEYPTIDLKQINEGSYSYTDSKSATYLTIGLAKSLDPNFESYI